MRKPRGGCGDRGGATGKYSKIEADCIKAEDGSVTCDTKVVNPASDTKAPPYTTTSTTEARE